MKVLFIFLILFLYLIVFTVDKTIFFKALGFSAGIFVKVIPVLFLVFILMFLVNCFVSNETLVKWLGSSAGVKGWLFSIIGGVLSTGPIYLWYPFLSDLKEKGVRTAFIACFLYNRAVKLPLMPLFAAYFGFKTLIILTCVMIIFSVIQGLIVEKIAG